MVGLSLFLAILVMQPVIGDIYHKAWEPMEAGQMTWKQALDVGSDPLPGFFW